MLSFVLVVEFDYAYVTYTMLGEGFGPPSRIFHLSKSHRFMPVHQGGVKLQNFPLTDRSSSY